VVIVEVPQQVNSLDVATTARNFAEILFVMTIGQTPSGTNVILWSGGVLETT
jgi:hypothetical protein